MSLFARRRRILPRALVRAWCALVVIAVLCGIVQTRTRYFYCESLGLSLIDPCVGAAHRQPACPLAALDRTPFDCCERITMSAMPEGAGTIEPTVSPAGVVAFISPVVVAAVESAAGSRAALGWEGQRWRGPPRSSRARRTQLMVFLT